VACSARLCSATRVSINCRRRVTSSSNSRSFSEVFSLGAGLSRRANSARPGMSRPCGRAIPAGLRRRGRHPGSARRGWCGRRGHLRRPALDFEGTLTWPAIRAGRVPSASRRRARRSGPGASPGEGCADGGRPHARRTAPGIRPPDAQLPSPLLETRDAGAPALGLDERTRRSWWWAAMRWLRPCEPRCP
jgi:hypothetical protein